MDEPRVIIVSPDPPSFETGTGVTIRNLFRGWKRENLAAIFTNPLSVDFASCERFYQVGANEISWTKTPSGSVKSNNIGTGAPKAKPGWVRSLLGNSGLPKHFHLSKELELWVEAFQPQIVYTTLGPIPVMEAALSLAKRFQAKLVVHYMDDWHPQAYTTGLFRFQRQHFEKLLAETLELGSLHIAISPAMAKVYSARYHKEFSSFQNTIPVAEFTADVSRVRDTRREDRTTILYFGSVLPFAQLETLSRIAEAVEDLKFDGKSVTLRVVTTPGSLPACRDRFGFRRGVELDAIGSDSAQFAEELGRSDVLILPVNFDAQSVNYVRYSMPTKVPGYLASGVPILVCGPSEVAQVEYAKEEGWGAVCTSTDPNEIRKTLKQILQKTEYRTQLTTRAGEVAQKNHDSGTQLGRFRSALSTL